jgi:hypothetical protein
MVEGLNEQQLEKQQMPGRFKDLQTVLAVDEEAQMGHSAMQQSRTVSALWLCGDRVHLLSSENYTLCEIAVVTLVMLPGTRTTMTTSTWQRRRRHKRRRPKRRRPKRQRQARLHSRRLCRMGSGRPRSCYPRVHSGVCSR